MILVRHRFLLFLSLPVYLIPVSISDKKIIRQEIENSSSPSPAKLETEHRNKMQTPKLPNSLFSRLGKSSSTVDRKTENDNNTNTGSGWLKNNLDPRKIITSKVPLTKSPEDANKATKSSKIAKDADKDLDDASSETGTYTVEKEEPAVARARKSIEKMLRVTNDSEISGAAVDEEQNEGPSNSEWVREWAEQAAILHKKNKGMQIFRPLYMLNMHQLLLC